jgi:hypothetical protein
VGQIVVGMNMKKTILLISLVLFVATSLTAGDFLSLTFKTRPRSGSKGKEAQVVPLWRISPSVSLDLYVEEMRANPFTHDRRTDWQISPGFGYGIRYNPSFLDKFKDNIKANYLLAVDLFLRFFPSDEINDLKGNDYFNFDILPTLTILDWFSIGVGVRLKRAQHPGLESYSSGLFCIGLRKAL